MGVAAYKFIHNRHNVYFDQTVDIFFLSRFFEWHQDVIETHFDSPFEFVNHYLEPGEQVDLENIRIQKRYFDTFNWALNDYGGGREADETR